MCSICIFYFDLLVFNSQKYSHGNVAQYIHNLVTTHMVLDEIECIWKFNKDHVRLIRVLKQQESVCNET